MSTAEPHQDILHTSWFRWLPTVGFLFAIPGMALVLPFFVVTNPLLADDRRCVGIVLMAASLATLLVFRLETLRPAPRPLVARWRWSPVACLAGSALAIALYTFLIGMRQVAGFDYSALIDVPWRLFVGQRPYFDFPCTLPIGFYLPAYHALLLGGPVWSSLVGLNSLFAAGIFVWSAVLLRGLLGEWPKAWALAMALQACTSMFAGFWWYNTLTSLAGCVFLFSTLGWLKRPGAPRAAISWTASLLLFASCKPNIAGPMILGTMIVLVFSPGLRRRALMCAAMALAAFLIIIEIHGFGVTEMLGGYLSVASRGFTLNQFLQGLPTLEKALSLLTLGATLITLSGGLVSRGRIDAWTFVVFVCVVSGLYGYISNGESKLVDMTLILGAAGVCLPSVSHEGGFSRDGQAGFSWLHRIQLFLIVFLGVTGVCLGWTRYRVRLAGVGTFYENTRLKTVSDGFFAGLDAGPIFLNVSAEINEAIHTFHPGRPFYGPRLQWAYAQTHTIPPVDQPSWWHPGVSYPLLDEDLYVQNWENTRHDMLVFLRGDYTYLPSRFLNSIQNRYYLAAAGKGVVIFRPKPEQSPAQAASIHHHQDEW
jgi:hypothetical protein